MFDSSSRYASVETASMSIVGVDGIVNEVRFLRRRFLPPGHTLETLVEHTVALGERLDNVTAKYLADPTQFWLVCDGNDAMNPFDLTKTVGSTVKIPAPQFQGM